MQIETMILGVQTNVGNTLERAIWKCRKWAPETPETAKSFTFNLVHTDYYGNYRETETGYATVNVAYFSKPDEGQYKVKEKS